MATMHTGRRIIIFLLLTFVITFAYELFVLPGLMANAANATMTTAFIGVAMFIPAICVLLTRLISKEGFKDVWIRPRFKGRIRFFILAWFGPSLLIIAGAVVYFLVYPAQFDPTFGSLSASLAAAGTELPSASLVPYLLTQTLIAALISPALNIIVSFGEEWGWRGYLLPKLLERIKIIPALLISGIIWGLWHAPLIAIGHNYGLGYAGFPWTGIVAMCGFCFVLGVFFSYVTLKTRSCLPAAIAHGALNGMASISLMVMPAVPQFNPFVGPIPTGILGGSALLVCALILLIVMKRDEKAGKLIAPAFVAVAETAAQPLLSTDAKDAAAGRDELDK